MKSFCRRNIKIYLVIIFILCNTLSGCTGYMAKKPRKICYKITQYIHSDAAQYTFYTIEDVDGNLIVIDGGHDNETEVSDVKEVISKHHNHVKTWILTHAHPDHVGAFNRIVSEQNNITIDEIYTIEVHDKRYRETAKDYDGIEVYDSLLKNIEVVKAAGTKVNYVYEGDSFSSLGLQFNVLHTWDDEVDLLENNLMNNGSMVFTVKGNVNSMLFLADAENEVEDDIIKNHANAIEKADFIQLGHHGNWGMTTKFYDHTNPKEVFFDSGNFIFEESDEHKYDAALLRDYFLKRNIKVNLDTDAPNVITIE